MCKSNHISRVDKCIKELIKNINFYFDVPIVTVASCCGHGKYPMTIVVQDGGNDFIEICHGVRIPRKRKFYKKDGDGLYYIPEVQTKRGN